MIDIGLVANGYILEFHVVPLLIELGTVRAQNRGHQAIAGSSGNGRGIVMPEPWAKLTFSARS